MKYTFKPLNLVYAFIVPNSFEVYSDVPSVKAAILLDYRSAFHNLWYISA